MSSRHHRRRSPSPDGSDSGSDSYYGDRRRRPDRRSASSAGANPYEPNSSTPRPPRRDREPRNPPAYETARRQFDTPSAVPPNMRPQARRSNTYDDRRDRGDRYDDRSGRERGDVVRHRGYSDDDNDYRGYGRRSGPGGRREYESDNEYGRPRSRSRERTAGSARSKLESMKPIVEDVLAAFGLLSEKHSRDYGNNLSNNTGRPSGRSSRDYRGDRDRDRYDDRDRDRGRAEGSGGMSGKQSQALTAAIMAAAAEAFRQRKEPGGFTTERILKIASAAIAAGGLDAIIASGGQGSTRQLIESVLSKGGSLLGGSSSGSGSRRRDGDRSRSGTGLSGLIRSLTVSERDRR